tara:strand:- start:322 stop:1020 length:699 start_codon:yes stop_codon:yes gene_type:complete
MSYGDILRANADMFEKTKLMLELDARNAKLERGLNNKQINKEVSSELILNKILRLVDEKKKIMNELQREYNRDTSILKDKYETGDIKDTLILNQEKEINRNDKKLNMIRNDILTLRRQLELGENEYRKKSFYLFFLKNIFIFLLFGLLLGLLVKNNRLSMTKATYAAIVLVVVFVLIIAYNLFMNRNRNSNIFEKQDWAAPTLDKVSDSTTSFMPKIGFSVKADFGTKSNKQ